MPAALPPATSGNIPPDSINPTSISAPSSIIPQLSIISVYPNPASTHIYINTVADVFISITDMEGKEIVHRTPALAPLHIIKTADWKNGIYLLLTTDKITGKVISVNKFIKQKNQ